jgi:hypothetical protein
MKKRNIFTKLSIAIALMALAAIGAAWQIRRVHAMPTAVEDQAAFGMVGLTLGQTVRLNMVNLTPPGPPVRQVPPGPCRVVLSFRDANGRPFTDSSGEVVRREVSLQSGESAFLDLNGDLFAPPSTNGAGRLQLRPFVRVISEPHNPDGNLPPGPCRATMEVFDNATGRTSVFSAGFEPPPDPDRAQ